MPDAILRFFPKSEENGNPNGLADLVISMHFPFQRDLVLISFVMPKVSLAAIVRHCDRLLRTNEIQDYDGAVNGLQVENRKGVSRIAAAVDGSLATVRLAIAARADLLIVHHGLFWSPSHPWT